MRMSTYERWCWYFCYHISTHDLTRRSIYSSFLSTFKCTVFQLTTSRGGRLTFSSLLFARYSFQLTTSQGGRRSCNGDREGREDISTHDLARRSTANDTGAAWLYGLFQLTTSQGGRLSWWKIKYTICTISTHDLARRSTLFLRVSRRCWSISTHDLARRSTSQ